VPLGTLRRTGKNVVRVAQGRPLSPCGFLWAVVGTGRAFSSVRERYRHPPTKSRRDRAKAGLPGARAGRHAAAHAACALAERNPCERSRTIGSVSLEDLRAIGAR
jgi:hypothetical protein